jgi:hypothetical protein
MVCALCSSVVLGAAGEQERLVASVTAEDLVGIDEPNLSAMSFDFTPDNSQIAVEFRARREAGTVAVWVGQWGLPAKQFLRACKADELSVAEAHNSGFNTKLRFVPDGRHLVVLTGPRIRVLSAETCAIAGEFGPATPKTRSPQGMTIRTFDIARDSGSIAVLSDNAQYSLPGIRAIKEAESWVQVFDLFGGEKLGEFSLQGAFRKLAIAPSGHQIVMSGVFRIPGDAGEEDTTVFDVKTGNIARRFNSGFWGSGDIPVAFVSSSKIAVAPTADTDSWGRYSGKSVRIFDAGTGKMVQEIAPPKFGPLGFLAVSPDGTLAATVSYWQGRRERLSDNLDQYGSEARAKLIVLRLADGKSFQLNAPVRQGKLDFTQDQYCLRLSADGSLLALFQGQSVNVYQVPASARNSPGASESPTRQKSRQVR